MTIQQLRTLGYTVFVQHIRELDHGWAETGSRATRWEWENAYGDTELSGTWAETVLGRGGETHVEVSLRISGADEYMVLGSGVAFCNSKDMFNRKLGVKIALGRALKEAAQAGYVFSAEAVASQQDSEIPEAVAPAPMPTQESPVCGQNSWLDGIRGIFNR